MRETCSRSAISYVIYLIAQERDDESLMMIRDSQEKELPTKQGSAGDDKARTSTRPWSGLKDPRIVRVSRAFGGKDRHSKVSTVRGLRDRRVRLSVPTAIQLYDLQDRLGLNQPSKVIDWLLGAAQHEIDKLPPLQMPPGNFIQFPQSSQISHEAIQQQASSSLVENLGYTTVNGARPLTLFSGRANHEAFGHEVAIENLAALPKSNYWHSDVPQKTKQKKAPIKSGIERGNNIKGKETGDDVGIHFAQVSANDPLSRPHQSSLGLLSSAMPYTSYYQWEPTNDYVSNLGIHSTPAEGPPTSNPSLLSSTPPSQLVFCPPGAMPSVFDFDPKQFGHLQVVSSASQNTTPVNSTRSFPAARTFQSNLVFKNNHSESQNEG